MFTGSFGPIVLSGHAGTAPSPPPFRVAVVTAYYDEERHLLERCLRSVMDQTVAATHLVIADGRPQDWLDATEVRHIKLDRNHGDYGGTPRGIGALLAVTEDYDVISFLDADNWLEPNHVELAIKTALGTGTQEICDFVIARRNLTRPDESIIGIEDQPIEQHVDTNCFVFFAGSFHVMQKFAMIPRQMSAIGDRLFYQMILAQKLRSAVIAEKTVNYHCLWETVYTAAGETPPPGAKPNIDQAPIRAWIAGLTPRQRQFITRRTGLGFK